MEAISELRRKAIIHLAQLMGNAGHWNDKSQTHIYCEVFDSILAEAKRLGLRTDAIPADLTKELKAATVTNPWGNEVWPTSKSFERLYSAYLWINSQVWFAEDVCNPETKENKPFRDLGRIMHAFYECLKYDGLVSFGTKLVDPTFQTMYDFVSRQAADGNPWAVGYLYGHWGMTAEYDK